MIFDPRRSHSSARRKLALTLAFILAAVCGTRGHWAALSFGTLAAVLLAAVWKGGVSPIRWALRVACLEPFALGAATLALWQPNGAWLFAAAVARATLCLGALVLLTQTTEFSELLHVLRSARMPSLLLTTLVLMERYRFVLMEESSRMRRARTGRTLIAGRGAAWRGLADVLAHLFLRALSRSERIYSAMLARGWR